MTALFNYCLNKILKYFTFNKMDFTKITLKKKTDGRFVFRIVKIVGKYKFCFLHTNLVDHY